MTKQEKLSKISNNLNVSIAEEKAKKAAAEAEYYANVHRLQKGAQEMREAVYNEPEEPQDNEQPTVWLNGEQHTAVITARRILRKLPPIPYNCSVGIALNHYGNGGITLQINAYNPNREKDKFEEVWLREHDEPEKQAADVSDWFERVERLFAFKPDNSHVAEPLGRALDAIFGGNLVGGLNEIVDGVTRKEADNE